MQPFARFVITLFFAAGLLAGCERIHLFGSGGSSSKPDIGVGVEL